MYLLFTPYSVGNKRFFLSETFINFIYKNFDIDAFDHCELLFDDEDLSFQDNAVEYYHELSMMLRNLNTTIVINSKHDYSLNECKEKVGCLRFPVLYYISIYSLSSPWTFRLLQNITSIGMANDIWLVALDNFDSRWQNIQDFSSQIEILLPNLELDSQVFVTFPIETNCDNFNVYEIYKVCKNDLWDL